jgi:hypothetical protein
MVSFIERKVDRNGYIKYFDAIRFVVAHDLLEDFNAYFSNLEGQRIPLDELLEFAGY